MAFENAQVGIARTAFYPHITLSGAGGWESTSISSLVEPPGASVRRAGSASTEINQGGRNR